jgi:hypothetical protein
VPRFVGNRNKSGLTKRPFLLFDVDRSSKCAGRNVEAAVNLDHRNTSQNQTAGGRPIMFSLSIHGEGLALAGQRGQRKERATSDSEASARNQQPEAHSNLNEVIENLTGSAHRNTPAHRPQG